MVGPQGSGKTVLGQKLCERSNMTLINFLTFIIDENLEKSDEETQVTALIRRLSFETKDRVLIENFP